VSHWDVVSWTASAEINVIAAAAVVAVAVTAGAPTFDFESAVSGAGSEGGRQRPAGRARIAPWVLSRGQRRNAAARAHTKVGRDVCGCL
jgi:hypothetical protein